MRIATLGLLAVLASASAAAAADLDYGYLRGADDGYAPAPVIDWSGFYIGGHGGYSSAGLGFRNSLNSGFAQHFRATAVEREYNVSSLLSLTSRRTEGTSFGAFAGYNVQFDDVVFGFEVDYTSFNRGATSSDFIGRQFLTQGGMEETVRLWGDSATKIEDFGTLRARAGYAVGSFLPYVTGGVAIGRAVITDNGYVQNFGFDNNAYTSNLSQTTGTAAAVYNHGYTSFNPSHPYPNSSPLGEKQTVAAPREAVVAQSKSKAVGGVALGAGLEFAVTSNIILRGEYQYVLFDDFDGHKANINTVRGGAAVKF